MQPNKSLHRSFYNVCSSQAADVLSWFKQDVFTEVIGFRATGRMTLDRCCRQVLIVKGEFDLMLHSEMQMLDLTYACNECVNDTCAAATVHACVWTWVSCCTHF